MESTGRRRALALALLLLTTPGCGQLVVAAVVASSGGGGGSGGGASTPPPGLAPPGPPTAPARSFTVVLDPALGPSSGGTQVVATVTTPGVRLGAGVTVTVQGIRAQHVQVDPAGDRLTFVTPPEAAGNLTRAVLVEISAPGLAGSPAGFTYRSIAPTLLGVSPSSGSVAGGDSITLTGTGFVTGSTVSIGGVDVGPVTVHGPASSTCVVPPGAAGPRDVALQHPDGWVTTLPAGFTYVATTPPPPSSPPPPAPAAPTGLTATVSGATGVALAWTDGSSGEDGFRVERRAQGTSTFGAIATVAAGATSFLDATASAEMAYEYRVLAFGPGGDSLPSNVAAVTTPPVGPTGLGAVATGPTATSLSWTDRSSAETGYRVERRLQGGGAFAAVISLGPDATAFSDAVAAEIAYEYRVLAVGPGGDSAPSNTASVTTPPPAPEGLSAVAGALEVALAWTDRASAETGFRVERSVQGGGAFGAIATVAPDTTTYRDGAAAETTFEYRVVAVGPGGDSPPSLVATATTPPAGPTALSALATAPDEVALTWTDRSAVETGVRIERRVQGAASFSGLTTLVADSTAFVDTTPAPGTSYEYRAIAVGTAGDSAPSNVATATTPGLPPAAPTGLLAVANGPFEVQLTWTDNSNDETGFRIQRRIEGQTSWSGVGLANPDVTSVRVATNSSTSYEFRVIAVKSGAADSAPSNIAAVTTPPLAPRDLLARALGPGAVELTWRDTTVRELSFRLERAPAGSGSFATLAVVASNTVAHRDLAVVSGDAYDYRVFAIGAGGDSPPSNVSSAAVPLADDHGSEPAAASALAVGGQVAGAIEFARDQDWFELTLRAGARYEVATGGPSGGMNPVLYLYAADGTTLLAWNDDHLGGPDARIERVAAAAGRHYAMVVHASTTATSGGYTLRLVELAPPPPEAPESLTAVATGPERVELAWVDRAAEEAGFRIERRVVGGSFATAGAAQADAVAWVDSAALPATSYEYRVFAVNSGGDSPPGNLAGATTHPPPIPDPPGSLTARLSRGHVRLDWVDQARFEAGYRIERRRPGDAFAGVGAAAADATTFTDATVAPLESYEYQVIAHNQSGDSLPSNQVAISVPARPTVSSISPTSGPLRGGTTLTITGAGFLAGGAGANTVELGGVPATGVAVISDTELTATAPRGVAPGPVDVVVTNDRGPATLAAAYRYVNHALRFDGGDAIDLLDRGFELGTEATFECWLKLDVAARGKIFSKWRVALEDKTLQLDDTGVPALYLAGPDGSVAASQPLPVGRWTHVAGVLDGDGMRIYVDGRLRVSGRLTGNVKDSSGAPRVGLYTRDGQTHPSIQGLLDELRISSVARYTRDFIPATRLATDSSTVLLLHLDEGEGTSTSDAGPRGNHGTLPAEPERPQWETQDILAPAARLDADVRLPAATVTLGSTGTRVEVDVENRGTSPAALQGAQLVLPAGLTATRLDSVAAVPTGTTATLAFAVDVARSATPGLTKVTVLLQATDLDNGADASVDVTRTPGQWQVVGWRDIGGSTAAAGISNTTSASLTPSLALDQSGTPIVAWAEGDAGVGEVYLARWSGAAWEGLSGSLTSGGISANAGDSRDPRVAMISGTAPAVAWSDDTSGVRDIYLATWTGSSWAGLGGSAAGRGLSSSSGASEAPALAVGSDGRPVVAWQELVAGGYEVHLRRWDGASWVELGGSASGGGVSSTAAASRAPALALTSAGAPVVAWLEDTGAGGVEVYLRAWDGSAWSELGGSATSGGVSAAAGDVTGVSLQVTSSGAPVVAWSAPVSGVEQVYLRRWDGTSWAELGGSASGGGISDSAGASLRPALALDAVDRPSVAWEDDTSGTADVAVSRWDGTSWRSLSPPASTPGMSGTSGASGRPTLAIDPTGQQVVAWEDRTRDASEPEVLHAHYRGTHIALQDRFDAGSTFARRFALGGDATHDGQAIRLTPWTGNRRGSLYYRESLRITSLRARFSFRINGEADGLALALIRGSELPGLGTGGGGLAIMGLDGYGVEVDVWGGPGDISSNHVALTEALTLLPLAQTDLPTPSLRNTTFTAEVLFDAGRFRMFLESAQIAYPRTLVLDHTVPGLTVFEGYLGLTAATGGVSAEHRIDDLLVVVE